MTAPRAAFLTAAALLCAGPTARGADVLALVGATVHPVSGPPLADAVVLIEDGLIRAVGPGASVPDGARVVRLEGKHVYPGFVSANSVLGLTEISAVAMSNDFQETGDVNPNLRAWVAVNPDSELLPVTRVNGITSALVAPRGGAISGTSAVIHLDGWTVEDVTVHAPAGLHLAWPAMTVPEPRPGEQGREERLRERDEAVERIRDGFAQARAWWTARDAEGRAGVPRHDRDVKWEAMGPALRGEIPVFVHASALSQIRAALDFLEEQELANAVLVDAADAAPVVDELKRRDIAVITPPVLATPGRNHEPYDAAFTLPSRLHEAGVRFCIGDGGTAFGASNSRNLPYHAAMAAAFGLPREAALRAITLSAAQILGVGDRLGSIEPGKVADLVVADGDPLEITTVVEQVYVAGRPVPMESRHTRLFERWDARPRGAHARSR